MDQAQAEATVERHLNEGVREHADALVALPGATVRKPYGWVVFVQSRAFVETGDWHTMAVGVGPVVVLRDGSVHTLGSARPPAEVLYAFEVDHGLVDQRGTPSLTTGSFPQDAADIPVWVGAQDADRFAVLALTERGLVSAQLRHAEVEQLLEGGPGLLDTVRSTTVPLASLQRLRTDGDTGLQVERRDDVNLVVRFPTPEQRDQAFSALHRLLAPRSPLEHLRRPRRQFVQVGGMAVLLLVLGFALPWMVETGQVDRADWLVATVVNTLGLTGFRVLGVVLAAACLVGLVTITLDNPPRAGFRVRPPNVPG